MHLAARLVLHSLRQDEQSRARQHPDRPQVSVEHRSPSSSLPSFPTPPPSPRPAPLIETFRQSLLKAARRLSCVCSSCGPADISLEAENKRGEREDEEERLGVPSSSSAPSSSASLTERWWRCVLGAVFSPLARRECLKSLGDSDCSDYDSLSLGEEKRDGGKEEEEEKEKTSSMREHEACGQGGRRTAGQGGQEGQETKKKKGEEGDERVLRSPSKTTREMTVVYEQLRWACLDAFFDCMRLQLPPLPSPPPSPSSRGATARDSRAPQVEPGDFYTKREALAFGVSSPFESVDSSYAVAGLESLLLTSVSEGSRQNPEAASPLLHEGERSDSCFPSDSEKKTPGRKLSGRQPGLRTDALAEQHTRGSRAVGATDFEEEERGRSSRRSRSRGEDADAHVCVLSQDAVRSIQAYLHQRFFHGDCLLQGSLLARLYVHSGAYVQASAILCGLAIVRKRESFLAENREGLDEMSRTAGQSYQPCSPPSSRDSYVSSSLKRSGERRDFFTDCSSSPFFGGRPRYSNVREAGGGERGEESCEQGEEGETHFSTGVLPVGVRTLLLYWAEKSLDLFLSDLSKKAALFDLSDGERHALEETLDRGIDNEKSALEDFNEDDEKETKSGSRWTRRLSSDAGRVREGLGESSEVCEEEEEDVGQMPSATLMLRLFSEILVNAWDVDGLRFLQIAEEEEEDTERPKKKKEKKRCQGAERAESRYQTEGEAREGREEERMRSRNRMIMKIRRCFRQAEIVKRALRDLRKVWRQSSYTQPLESSLQNGLHLQM